MCLNHKFEYFCGHEAQLDGMFHKCSLRPSATPTQCDCPELSLHYLQCNDLCPACYESFKTQRKAGGIVLASNELERFAAYIRQLQHHVDLLDVQAHFEMMGLDGQARQLREESRVNDKRRMYLSHTMDQIIERTSERDNSGRIVGGDNQAGEGNDQGGTDTNQPNDDHYAGDET